MHMIGKLLVSPSGARTKLPMQDMQRYRASPWAGRIPQRRAWQLIPVFLPGGAHEHRKPSGLRVQSVAKESYMTEVTKNSIGHR